MKFLWKTAKNDENDVKQLFERVKQGSFLVPEALSPLAKDFILRLMAQAFFITQQYKNHCLSSKGSRVATKC